MRSLVTVALVAALFVGCHAQDKRAAEEKKIEAQVEQRATAMASEQANKAVQDSENRRLQEAQRVANARAALRQKMIDKPADFFAVGDLRMVAKGRFRQLASVSLTNNSQFAVTDVRGAVDLHGDVERPGNDGDVVATIPVELTGAIAPGASMLFSVEQHTLAATPLELPTPPTQVTFRVTGMRSVAPADDHVPPPAGL